MITRRSGSSLWGSVFAAFFVLSAVTPAIAADAQAKAPAAALSRQNEALLQMVGTWNVEQRIWSGPRAAPVRLPDAIARRSLIGGMFVQEIMEPASGSGQDPFVRVAYFNYNGVTRRFEAVSIDTRGPQLMYEKSHEDAAQGKQYLIKLTLDNDFVLPQWNEAANVAFKGRKVIEVGKDRQTVRLYWARLGVGAEEEFLAVEYVYTRQR